MYLKELRRKSGLKMIFIAKKINKSRQTYYNYETGKSIPDLKTISKLSNLFGVDFEVIEKNIIRKDKK